MEKKPLSPPVYGLVISIVLIIFGLIIQFTNQFQNKTLGYVSYAVLLIGIIIACVNYAKQMNGNVTYGNVFAHGFKTTAVVIVIMAIYTALALKIIFPDMIDKILETSRTQMEGKMADDQIEQALQMTRKFFLPFAIGGIIVIYGILGAIAAAIGAAVAKKNPQVNTPFN
ncbi:MAG: DUF4199 domain-containing protein [Filimonas sp.]|nr:DUF4199 domain-containing protein [Filimonas sp.]